MGPPIPAGQSSEFPEKALEPLTLGIRKGTVFRSTFELELNEEIEFAGGKRSPFDRAAEKVPQEGGTLKRFPGGFEEVYFPGIIGPGRLQGRPGFPGGPFECGAPHIPGNGKSEIAVALRKGRRSKAGEEGAKGLLRKVFPSESGIALAHAADG